jgi:hypothetical protein
MKKIIVSLIFSMFAVSCSEELLDPTLADSTTTETYIFNQTDLRQVVSGAYTYMAQTAHRGRDYIIFGELRGDNVFANGNSNRFVSFGDMSYTPGDGQVFSAYLQPYRSIALANIAIASNPTSPTNNDPQTVNHYKGEAYAIRALCHFDLLRLFGQQYVSGQGGENALGVPYVTVYRDPNNINTFPRLTVGQTKAKIYEDLDKALSLMTATGALNNNKSFITTHAVNAIKARVATYFGDTAIALAACEAVINGGGGFSITPAAGVVAYWNLAGSGPASIFDLAQTALAGQNNGIDSISNIYRGPAYGDIQVIQNFIANAGFETGDVRSSIGMIGPQTISGITRLRNLGKFPKMAPAWDNWIRVCRYEEVILNYAEALLPSNPGQALIELNKIPAARGASPYTVANIDNILAERRKEFAFEGFRFDDLARTGRNLPVISTLEQTHGGVTAGSYKYALPIPQHEMNTNPAMVQNFGYGNN